MRGKRRSIGLALALALALALRSTVASADGQLTVNAQAGDAIAIDGRAVGIASYEGTLPSGMHRVRVTANGKKPYERQIVIDDEQARSIDVVLENEGGRFPLWAAIGVGAVAATALVVISYFAFRGSGSSDDEKKSTPVTGTIGPGVIQLPSLVTFR